MNKKLVFIAFVVSLGGFLFGFDAGIISGVMNYVGPEFNLDDIQSGWVVSSPSWAAMIAMLFSGRLSDKIGRKKILILVALLYAISAIASALAKKKGLDSPISQDELMRLPEAVKEVLNDFKSAERIVSQCLSANRLQLIGRGLVYGAVLEAGQRRQAIRPARLVDSAGCIAARSQSSRGRRRGYCRA